MIDRQGNLQNISVEEFIVSQKKYSNKAQRLKLKI
jgi:hypothetical protein